MSTLQPSDSAGPQEAPVQAVQDTDASSPVQRPSRPASAVPRVPVEVEPDFLNLARRPFLNARPVVRAAMLLWLVGALILLGNVTLFWRYLSDSEEKRVELAEIESEIEAERERGEQALARVASAEDMEKHNRQILYLNRKISERTFSWSLLFDQLTQVLPNDVRLSRLFPSGVVGKESDRRAEVLLDESGRVTLGIQGEARNGEALLAFVDKLYAHPAFEDPYLSRESREEENGLLKFDLRVEYLPAVAAGRERAPAEAPAVRIEELPLAPGEEAPAAPSPSTPGGRQ